METVTEFAYLGERMSVGGGCVLFCECGELLHGRRFPIKLNRSAYKTYVRPTILYGSEAWGLKESKMIIL